MRRRPQLRSSPWLTLDGTVLTNSVTGTDTDGVPDPTLSDNTAQARTTVRAPVLTVGQSATVNAGRAITYANTGGGAASGVAITATLLLPVDSSTSARYSQIIAVLDDINANKIEVY
ncbi:hypothetical protein [Streptosporangium sp. H16]|uniref:hypothetical protein n=1 Tax=Streptosporangium sp. H16 TaxID=3444184 RepID=UPI003F7ADDFB